MSELLDKFKKFEDNKSEEKIIRPLSSTKVSQKRSSSRPKTISLKKDISILNEENLILFIKQTDGTKKYEMKHRFYNSTAKEISNLVEKLIKEGKLKRNRNGWINLKEVK